MTNIEGAVQEIDAKIAELQNIREGLLRLTDGARSYARVGNRRQPVGIRPKRVMSAEAREKIADAARRRWAALRGEAGKKQRGKVAAPAPAKKRRAAPKTGKRPAPPDEGHSS